MNLHTKGPWFVAQYHVESNTGGIAETNPLSSYPERLANARLIAAAPELLEACELALGALDCLSMALKGKVEDTELRRQLEAAIRKAKGEK